MKTLLVDQAAFDRDAAAVDAAPTSEDCGAEDVGRCSASCEKIAIIEGLRHFRGCLAASWQGHVLWREGRR